MSEETAASTTEGGDDIVHYPCPACGSPLYGWVAAHDPLHEGRKVVIDRCENCRLAVTRAPAPPDADAEVAALLHDCSGKEVELDTANGASVQAGIGGSQWAGLEPELRRLHLSPDASRRLLARRGIEVTEVSTPFGRDSYSLMRQTLINAFTFRDNFLRNARAGLLPKPQSGRDRWLTRLDWVVSVLVWVPCAVVAFPLELAAATFGRGGSLVVRGKTGEGEG